MVKSPNNDLRGYNNYWTYGTYVARAYNLTDFGVVVPWDTRNKGLPNIHQIDISILGTFDQNITIVENRQNAFVVASDDLPQNADYIGVICSVNVYK